LRQVEDAAQHHEVTAELRRTQHSGCLATSVADEQHRKVAFGEPQATDHG
jgi:hypothetical protein